MDHKEIHKSEYGDSQLNFHVAKHGDELHVDLTYPPWSDTDNEHGQCRYVFVDQEAVRASDGVRLHYDYGRDGFVVEQPRPYLRLVDGVYHSKNTWIEVGFFRSWKFDRPEDEQTVEADAETIGDGTVTKYRPHREMLADAMTPDQEALKITTAWGCGGDAGAMAMVRAVLIAERERCARIADIIGNDHGPRSDAHTVAASIRALTSH